jgi:hypothetical protein
MMKPYFTGDRGNSFKEMQNKSKSQNNVNQVTPPQASQSQQNPVRHRRQD